VSIGVEKSTTGLSKERRTSISCIWAKQGGRALQDGLALPGGKRIRHSFSARKEKDLQKRGYLQE